MTNEQFYELEHTEEVASNELTFYRSNALVSAVNSHRNFSMIQTLLLRVDDNSAYELLIVDVTCDEVPPNNQVGIQYRERLALCVPNDAKSQIEVLALRKDFPILMHQNQGVLGAPASLCLYFESVSAVMRTWTPQSFLRRIQWWLEKSAREELHPADQPVEQLFFATKYELILPWNLDKLRKNPDQQFSVIRQQARPDEGFTCFLVPASAAHQQTKTVKHIELILPPIVHGFVESDPVTLGQLSDLLKRRHVDLIGQLRNALQADVGQEGAVASSNNLSTVILLHIPIIRSAGADLDKVIYRAFFLPVNSLKLGVTFGVLFLHEGRYYQDLLNHEHSTSWRKQLVLPMDVLKLNDDVAARYQSGISDKGPTGILIGAGSLGSAMLNLWGRSGWGSWTVVDKDHIKPHNLSRHVAYAQHIGETKATVVAELHAAMMEGATSITPIVADACDFEKAPIEKILNEADLVIDASTTLEYPRATSAVDALPRHISVFVTPNGNGAVLLAEDAKRLLRLRTLEAQYYRAVIEQDWGEIHLAGHISTFWSGAGCRDISLVMPYSRILGHASTLAEQVHSATTQESAMIRIWQRDPVLGAIEVYDVPVMAEQRFELGELALYIDEGVLHQLRQLRQQGFPNETGGVLLGYYDFNIKAVVVVMGLQAPPDSKAGPTFFERGVSGLAEAIKDISDRTANMVRYIGEWHSHPPGHSASPSRDDLVQLTYLTLGMADEGLPAVQLIVGENDVQILHGILQ